MRWFLEGFSRLHRFSGRRHEARSHRPKLRLHPLSHCRLQRLEQLEERTLLSVFPNDPLIGQQYFHATMGDYEAWDIEEGAFGESDDILVAVIDTGIGIEPGDLPHVFDEFYRAANAREISPHGTGVGLAIVRRVIENWGGKIEAASEPGRGTRITFSLPQAQV